MSTSFTRRKAIGYGLGSCIPLAFSSLAAAATGHARAKACLVLFMDGGVSHVDTFDMKPDAPNEIRGPFGSIETSVPGTRVCEHLPLLAQQMHRVWQIRSVRHEEMVHDPAVYQMLTGYKHVSSAGGLKVEETDLPHIGSAFARAAPSSPAIPPFLEIPGRMTMEGRVLPGQSAGVLGASWDPFPVPVSREGLVTPPPFERMAELDERRWRLRHALLDPAALADAVEAEPAVRFEGFQRQAMSILDRTAISAAFQLDRESAATRDRYGRHRHGASVLLARRLVEAGARFISVYWGNEEQDWADGRGLRPVNNPWDTHRNHFPLVRDSLLPRADQALSALLEDLSVRGLLDDTLVFWIGDFGRTPRISRPWASRDHWPHAFTVLAAGAGLPMGSVYGKTDRLGEMVVDDPVSPADLTASMLHMLGVAPDVPLPTSRRQTHLASTGRPLAPCLN